MRDKFNHTAPLILHLFLSWCLTLLARVAQSRAHRCDASCGHSEHNWPSWYIGRKSGINNSNTKGSNTYGSFIMVSFFISINKLFSTCLQKKVTSWSVHIKSTRSFGSLFGFWQNLLCLQYLWVHFKNAAWILTNYCGMIYCW